MAAKAKVQRTIAMMGLFSVILRFAACIMSYIKPRRQKGVSLAIMRAVGSAKPLGMQHIAYCHNLQK
jgi:hypothetical protein